MGPIKETFKTIIFAGVVAVIFRTFLYEPFHIPSGSMEPTLREGDYLFVSKFVYGFSSFSLPFGLPIISGRIFFTPPKIGDVIVFKLPLDNKTDYIKRIVGLPGDTVSVKEGILHINGLPVHRATEEGNESTFKGTLYVETLPNGVSHQILERSDEEHLDETQEFTVPEDHYFALGDNRDNSNDSRRIVGFIPSKNLVGKAEIIFYSHNGKARFWEAWKWPIAIRYNRLFDRIN
jgi:signal peptidase I|tara:strand:+ start:1350 stop:2051 length:702 start_codon:yes stop_codon:yes gene_type:complete